MSFWQSIVNAYHNIPWSTVWAVLVASGFVALFVEGIKKWLALKKTWVIQVLNLTISYSMVAINYLLNEVNKNPGFLGGKGLAIAGAATTMYICLLKPAKNLLADVSDFKASKQTVATPAVETVEQPAPEFTA